MELPDGSDPIAGQKSERGRFMEGGIELLHRIALVWLLGLPQQPLGGIGNLDQEVRPTSVAVAARCDRLEAQARDDLRPVAFQQVACQFFAERFVEPAGHAKDRREKAPSHSRGRGPEERMSANEG